MKAKLNEDRQQRLAEDRKAIKDQKRDARAQVNKRFVLLVVLLFR